MVDAAVCDDHKWELCEHWLPLAEFLVAEGYACPFDRPVSQ